MPSKRIPAIKQLPLLLSLTPLWCCAAGYDSFNFQSPNLAIGVTFAREVVKFSDSRFGFDIDTVRYQFSQKDPELQANHYGINLNALILDTDTWHITLGLGYYTMNSLEVTGTHSEITPGNPNNYSFFYKLDIKQLMLESKVFLAPSYEIFQPFVSAGLGLGYTTMQDMHYSTSTQNQISFKGSAKTNLSTAIGLGVDILFTENWHLAVGYRWSNYGGLSSDYGKKQITVYPIKFAQTRLTGQQLYTELNYWF